MSGCLTVRFFISIRVVVPFALSLAAGACLSHQCCVSRRRGRVCPWRRRGSRNERKGQLEFLGRDGHRKGLGTGDSVLSECFSVKGRREVHVSVSACGFWEVRCNGKQVPASSPPPRTGLWAKDGARVETGQQVGKSWSVSAAASSRCSRERDLTFVIRWCKL